VHSAYGSALILCGVVSVFNGGLAGWVEAEKSYNMDDYVNTHWITSVFLFAGLSVWLLGQRVASVYVYLAYALCFVALPVAATSFVADAVNLHVVAQHTWPSEK
jgi:hypothetical protein